ncbi:MAG TPA: cytochrome P460 family protein [Povalibacter sp.]|nr:cytochrome P460 family protein [Povalibacter sp.]
MRARDLSLEMALVIAVLVSVVAAIDAEETPQRVHFPESYRTWRHVKSIVVGADAPLFDKRGGIHHYYANDLAVTGYASGRFPDGSVIVDEAVFTKDGEGLAKGILLEGERRFLEVMVKDDRLYKETGGWGFERFNRDARVGELTAIEQTQCFGCHSMAKDRDQVFSRIRP